MPKRIESWVLKRYVNMHTHVHSSIIHCSQKVEATQVPMHRQTDKHGVVCPYSGKSFSLKKEGNLDTCYNVDEPFFFKLFF